MKYLPPAIFILSMFLGFNSVSAPRFGAALPQAVAVFETSLASPISSSASSMTLTANAVRGGGSLSGYNCFTIDEGSAQAETICGTVSGTTVSSLTRGISQSTGTTTVSALQFAHRRGANVKITDFPVIQILKAQANGEDTFPNPLIYANGQHPCSVSSASTTICDKNYSDGLAAAGAAVGSNSVAGIFLSATGLQAASSTESGTYNAITYNYVIPASIATDTPNTATRGSRVLMSQIGGYLRQAWLDLTEDWTFSGAVSLAASAAKRLTLNSVSYAFPSAQGTASSTLMNDGSGTLKWAPASGLFYASTTPTNPSTNASTTIFSTTIPANTLVGNAAVKITVYFSAYKLSNTNSSYFDFAYGTASTTARIKNTSGGPDLGLANGMAGKAEFLIMANGASNAQLTSVNVMAGTGASVSATSTIITGNTSTASVDATQAQPIRLVFLTDNGTISLGSTLVTGEYIR